MIKKIHNTLVQIVQKGYWAFFAAACIALALFCFWRLDVKYVDSWDEARHGVNAYEMIQNDNYIQHTYNYEVDDWNLKPSLSYWGILLGFGIFGYGVFGLRFYSALCYLLTGIAASLFVKKKSKVGSILVLGFFCANTLPLYAHLARAGDADSLYLMLFTFAMLAMLQIPKNKKYLYVCGLCFSLAFLTKSWHAGMIAAIGGLYLLLTGEIRRIRLKEWLIFLACIFVPLLIWFGWRYQADGFTFLKQMVEVDLLARTGTDNYEGHSYPFSFYWDTVLGNTAYIYPWIVGVCAAAAVGLVVYWVWRRKRNAALGNSEAEEKSAAQPDAAEDPVSGKELGKLALGLALWFGITFIGFSAMKTKLIWYCYPAIVPLFVAAALALGWLIEYGFGKTKESGVKPWLPQLRSAGQILLAAGCMIWVAHFMKVTYDTAIVGIHGDGFQDFLQESADRDSAYAGRTAYIQVVGEKAEQLGDWDQNRLFLAEISGNFRCQDGGVEAFLEANEDCVLYIETAYYEEYRKQLEDYEILYEDLKHPYFLLGKQKGQALMAKYSEGDIRPFSYEEVLKRHKGQPGVWQDGFDNTSEVELSSVQDVIERARMELSKAYDENDGVKVRYDDEADMWEVWFYIDDDEVAGGDISIYLDSKGITHLTVAGE